MSLSRVRGSLKIYFFVFYDVVTCEHGEDGMGGLVRTEYACTHINIYICNIYIYIYTQWCVFVFVCVCVCIHTSIHACTHKQLSDEQGRHEQGRHSSLAFTVCITAYTNFHVILIPHPLLSQLHTAYPNYM